MDVVGGRQPASLTLRPHNAAVSAEFNGIAARSEDPDGFLSCLFHQICIRARVDVPRSVSPGPATAEAQLWTPASPPWTETDMNVGVRSVDALQRWGGGGWVWGGGGVSFQDTANLPLPELHRSPLPETLCLI